MPTLGVEVSPGVHTAIWSLWLSVEWSRQGRRKKKKNKKQEEEEEEEERRSCRIALTGLTTFT